MVTFALTLTLTLALLMAPPGASGASVCADSDNPDTNSAKECKYLSKCTKDDVPAPPAGYTIECETMPCAEGQDIMFDRIGGTDVGELLPAGCDNTVAACKGACEATPGCCGFNFVFNPGQYGSAQLGRCVAKRCDGRIGTSRYGMAYYARDAGAVTTPPPTPAPTPSCSLVTGSLGDIFVDGVDAACCDALRAYLVAYQARVPPELTPAGMPVVTDFCANTLFSDPRRAALRLRPGPDAHSR